MNVKGQAAIVTGGASGLGGATASALAAAGAKVAIFDLQDELGEVSCSGCGWGACGAIESIPWGCCRVPIRIVTIELAPSY